MSVLDPVLSPILVGRDEYLELAERRLADAAAGHGRMLLVSGEAGIGKTRLLRAIDRRAAAMGFRASQGDISPLDHDVPGALLLDCARSMRFEPALATVGSDIVDHWRTVVTSGATYSRTAVLDVVDRILGSIDGPTVLVFEDLQWADDLSLEGIGELARGVERLPLAIFGTYRRDETPAGTPLRDWRARLLTQRMAEEVRLERLTLAQTGTVTTLLLGTGMPAPRDLVEAVYQRSDGVPLHIEELIATVRSRGPLTVAAIRDAEVPDTIEDTILARTAKRSAEAQAVARAGAVLGRCFAPSVLAGMMDLPVGALDDSLQELVDHAILYEFGMVDEGYYDFRHQLVRDALYHSTPERDRRRFHARAGEFGARLEGASVVHASLHYERAGLRDQAFRAALEGAQEAVRVSAHREAFELYRRAVDNMPDSMPPFERAELLDAYASEAGAIEENAIFEACLLAARDAYLEAGRPDLAAQTHGGVLTIWRRNGRPLHARRQLADEIVATLLTLPPSPERERMLRWAIFDQLVIAVDANDIEAAHRLAAEIRAVAPADEPSALLDVAVRLAMADVIAGRVDEGMAALERAAIAAREAGAEESAVTAMRDRSGFAIRVMRYDEAERALAEGRVYADSIQQSHCAHVMSALAAELDWTRGRWDDAIAVGRQAVADHGCRRAPAMARWSLGYVALGRGELDEARSILGEALAFGDESEMVEWRLPPMWGLAETALAGHDPHGAVDLCEAALAVAQEAGERALLVPFVVTGVRAFQAAGRPADAERWLATCEAFLAATPAFQRPALDHGRGLVRLAAGSTGAARDCLETAVVGWDERGRIWEANWARLDLAQCLLRSNRFAAALALAAQVREAAGGLGSPALMAQAEGLVRNSRGRIVDPEPWHPLTAREFEVARLIREGRTNAEIADELGIAPKTASSHVEHILDKLGAGRRAEIAAWASHVEGLVSVG